MRARLSLIFALACATGCPAQGAAPERGAQPAATEPGQAAREPGARASSAPAEPVPLPETLVLTTEQAEDGVVLVVQNRGTAPVEVSLAASVEQATSAGATAGEVDALRLDCAEDAPRCLSLVPGAEQRAAAWPAKAPRAQCGAGARAAAAPGSYRVRVRGCQGGARVSAPFELR